MLGDKQRYNILLIEDNDGDNLIVNDYLEDAFPFHNLTRLETFAQTEVIENSNIYDVVLLDLSLPDKERTELVEAILIQFPLTPIIALTGYADIEFARKSLALGIADYLIKENTSADLLHKSIIYSIERQKNVVTIAKSEQLYMDLFDFNPKPTWVYDMETLKFLDVNACAVKNYGYSKEEFLSMTLKDIRPKEELKRLKVSLKLLKHGGTKVNNRIFTHIKKNKEKIRVKIDSKIISYKNRKAVVVVADDITEQLNHLETIEKQNEELRRIAWLQSHVVRAPVAKIMSISNLLTENPLSVEERIYLFKALNETTIELDISIRKVVDRSDRFFDHELEHLKK